MGTNSGKVKITTIVILSVISLSSIRTEFAVGRTYHLREDWSFDTLQQFDFTFHGTVYPSGESDGIDSPLHIYDINSDGELEFIFQTNENHITCYSKDGTRLWKTLTDVFTKDPVVDDLDNDLYFETIVSTNGFLYVFDHTGEMIWNTWSMDLSYIDHPYTLDLDNDSFKEVFIGSSYSNMAYCFDHTGNLLWNFTTQDNHNSYTYSYAIPTSADLDNDGYQEILFSGADASYGNNEFNKFYCLNYNGTLRWDFITDGFVSRTAIVEDINNDNSLEIVIQSRSFLTDQAYLYCLDVNGTLIWKHLFSNLSGIHPKCYDLNNDGFFEIIYSRTNGTSEKSFLECYDYQYNLLWQIESDELLEEQIAIADIDNDTIPEILAYTSNYNSKCFYCFTNSSALMWKHKMDNSIYSFNLIDTNQDGFLEFICAQPSIDKIVCFKLFKGPYYPNITLFSVYVVSFGVVILSVVVTINNRKRKQRTSSP